MTGEVIKIDHVPLVSVLMPCYNHEAYVISALESVAASDYKSIEFIFIDDASKDNSFNLANKWFEENKGRFVRAVCMQHEKNRGICGTLNELYGLSRGEYINIIASDDNLLPDGLSKQVSFATRRDVDFVFSDLKLIDEAGNLVSDSALQYYGKNAHKLENKVCLIVDIIFFWGAPWNKSFMSSALVKKIGLFDDSLCFEDRDFAVRVLINGSFALMLDTNTAYRIRSKGSASPGLVFEKVMSDFRKTDCKNYLNSSGIVRLLLGILVYSYEEKYKDLGIKNAVLIWLASKVIGLLMRLILKTHRALMM